MSAYSVWLLPNSNDQEKLRKTIEKLCSTYKAPLFLPHLTILGNTGTSLERAISITKKTSRSLGPIKGTTLNIAESDYFFKTVFVRFKKDKEILNIHKTFNKEFDKHVNTNTADFDPHLSLIYKEMSQNERLRIISELKIDKHVIFDKLAIATPSNKVMGWSDVDSWTIKYQQDM